MFRKLFVPILSGMRVILTLIGLAILILVQGCGSGSSPIDEPDYPYSFENSLEGWATDVVDDEIGDGHTEWSVDVSNSLSYEGDWSVKFYMDNINDATKLWIEKAFPVTPGHEYNVVVQWKFTTAQDYGIVDYFGIIASISASDPETRSDFNTIDQTVDESGWHTIEYSAKVTPSGTGDIWVGIGVWGVWEAPMTFYVDSVTVDITPVD